MTNVTMVPSLLIKTPTFQVEIMVPAILLQVLFKVTKLLLPTKVINAINLDPERAFAPVCFCCLAMNLRPEVRKYIFPDCPFVSIKEFCSKAFISVCVIVNNWRKKEPMSDISTSTASQATHELALKRLEWFSLTLIGSDNESSIAA